MAEWIAAGVARKQHVFRPRGFPDERWLLYDGCNMMDFKLGREKGGKKIVDVLELG